MIRTLRDADVAGKAVLLRLDLDLPQTGKHFDTTRLENGLATLTYLLAHGAERVTVIGHLGRPGGKIVKKLSLKPIEALLRKKLSKADNERLTIKENLRFDSREEKGSGALAKSLAKGHDLYVYDAFAVMHRDHTSVTHIPKILKTVIGFQVEKEIHALDKALNEPKRPFILILGGAKLETKLPLIQSFQDKADVILVGGKLAAELKEHAVRNRRLIVAELTKNGKDITNASIQQFRRFIAMARTIVWNGPMGVFEDKESQEGTRSIAQSIDRSLRVYSVIGGGDTEAAATKFHAEKHISHISTGGGAMLDYLAYGTLPGIQAIALSNK